MSVPTEETRELTGQSSDRTVPSGDRTTGSSSTRGLDWPRALRDPGLAPEDLAGALLETLVERLSFERGFLLLEDDETTRGAIPGAGSPPGADRPLRLLASRRRTADASESADRAWEEVRNPELAVNRSVIQLALGSGEALADGDCLVPPERGQAEQHRCVLCSTGLATRARRAVVYLDRGLGLVPIAEREKEAFRDLVDEALPLLGRAWLESARAATETEGRRAVAEDEPGDTAEESGDALQAPSAYHGIVGRDEALLKVFEVVEKVKDTDLSVCIFGESGTGKELVARAIHESGVRGQHRFVSENCGAVSENLLESELFGHVKGSFTGADDDKQGLFELADRGTLFLDEIGDMSEGMQRKLLRALQEGEIRPIGAKASIPVDVRVICASNRDLKHLVKEGRFRADLYYRLNVIQIQVPPLRERRGDIPLLIDAFTARFNEEESATKRFSDSARTALTRYGWPGNIRELQNVLRRALLTSPRRVIARKDVIGFLSGAESAACLGQNLERDDDHLVLRIPLRRTFGEIIDECERLVLENALRETGWNKSRVTKLLGIPRQSLYNKIAKHDLQKEWSEDPSGQD